MQSTYAPSPDKISGMVNGDWINQASQFRSMVPSRRRRFLAQLGLALGAPVVFADLLSQSGIFPRALAQSALEKGWPGKEELRLLSDRPLNAEAYATLLDDPITPNHRHFVRNNGLIPDRAKEGNLSDWSLRVDGEVQKVLDLDMAALKGSFKHVSAALVIECGGNGRAGFYPKVGGNPWTLGAVGCARYTGARLRDVLREAGVRDSAVYLAYHAEDPTLNREPGKAPISRGVPIEKALDPHTLLAWEMNGVPLPPEHGFPLRLICPGWPGSTSGKWLKRLQVRDRVHDGPKMTGTSYRVPRHPVFPGEKVPEEDFEIIGVMPVKSLITRPAHLFQTLKAEPLEVGGHAWCGEGKVRQVDVTIDYGSTWQRAKLQAPVNPYAWQSWHCALQFPGKGYFEVWARATDEQGRHQPMVVPGWNPKGYLNNAMHRIAVQVI